MTADIVKRLRSSIAFGAVHGTDTERSVCEHQMGEAATEIESMRAALSGGAGLIAAERQRQVSQEGWTAEHDDQHRFEELQTVAIAYIKHGDNAKYANQPPPSWPWDAKWWKPSRDHVRNLIKAGALIAAEIDRLQRNGQPLPAAPEQTAEEVGDA